MVKLISRIVLLIWATDAMPVAAQTPSHRDPNVVIQPPALTYERFTLTNGLTVILSPDHTAPLASLHLWYHVGSKNEVPGHTGFAHLFEHMMFEGSLHVAKGEHFKMIEAAGGQSNAETQQDVTLYFETFPINDLERVIWLESDRMGYLLPALTQEKLDNQRDVVKNERRQSIDNQPYGLAIDIMSAALYPAGHPYSWPVIGSMADLSAASLDDVKRFFHQWYAPNNAVLAIAGDIDVERTKALVTRYFGPIPGSEPIVRPAVPLVTLSSEKRLVLEDAHAKLPQLVLAWPTVPDDVPDAYALSALGQALGFDRTSRLNKVLVHERQLASHVLAANFTQENAGQFQIIIDPQPGAALTEIERVTDSVLAIVRDTLLRPEDIHHAVAVQAIQFVLRLQSADTKALQLAASQTLFGDPLHYRRFIADFQAVTPADIQRVARQYLTPGRLVLSMVPAGQVNLISRPDLPYTNVTPASVPAAKGQP